MFKSVRRIASVQSAIVLLIAEFYLLSLLFYSVLAVSSTFGSNNLFFWGSLGVGALYLSLFVLFGYLIYRFGKFGCHEIELKEVMVNIMLFMCIMGLLAGNLNTLNDYFFSRWFY